MRCITDFLDDEGKEAMRDPKRWLLPLDSPLRQKDIWSGPAIRNGSKFAKKAMCEGCSAW